MLEQLQEWGRMAGFVVEVTDDGPPFRLSMTLDDQQGVLPIEVWGPKGDDDPVRFRYQFELPTAGGRALSDERAAALLEAAVVQRSTMVDARLSGATTVDMVVALYADGVTRHGFMTAVFECQKLRQVVRREVEAALVSESAVASLRVLAEATNAVNDAVEAALPSRN